MRRMIRVGLSPQILLMVSKVYVPVLFPTTFLIAWTSLAVDRALGLGPFLPWGVNFAVAAASLEIAGWRVAVVVAVVALVLILMVVVASSFSSLS